ncbi:MAG: hypothetical protein H6577_27875 [Lewinellaceae bacterium]|nr:hypothetical protein [Lewinellaceae bacterium]
MAIGRHQTHNPKALPQPVLQARSFPCKSCRTGSRSAPAAGTAVPFHCTRFRFTSLLSLLSSHPPPTQSDCHEPVCPTRKLANAEAKPAPQPFGANPPTIAPGSGAGPRSSSSVTSVPPATLPLLFAIPLNPQKIPPSAAEWKTVTNHTCQSAAAAFFANAANLNHTATPALPQQAQRHRFTAPSFRFTLVLPLLFCYASAYTTVSHDLVIPPV